MSIGRNALHFNDYVVSIGHFSQIIGVRPWMAEPYFYRAVAKISLEDYEGAEADASEALERNPFLSKAYMLRGVARQNLARHTEAIGDYQSGLSLMPGDQSMRYNLVIAQLETEQYEASSRSLDTLVRFGYDTQSVGQLRTRIALGQGDTLRAVELNRQLLESDPLFVPAHLVRAQLSMQAKDYTKADQSLSEAISLSHRPGAQLFVNRAICRYQINNLRGAMADYTEALRLEPSNHIARYNRALLRLDVGEYRPALEDWDEIVGSEPANYMARYNRALLLSHLGRTREALKDLDEVLASHPNFEAGFLQRAHLRQQIGDERGAQRDRLHVYDLRENKAYQKASARGAKSQAKATRGAEDQAIEKYNQLIEGKILHNTEDKPSYSSRSRGLVQNRQAAVEPVGYFDLSLFDLRSESQIGGGNYYSRQLDEINYALPRGVSLYLRERKRALEEGEVDSLSRILALFPEEGEAPNTLAIRAVALSLLQDLDEAHRLYSRAIELSPRQSLLYMGRAITELRRQEVRQSRLQEETSAKASPTSPSRGQTSEPHRGRLVISADNPLADLNRAIELSPDLAYAYYNRAIVLAAMNESSRAIADYSRALELNPQFGEAYYNRGLLYLSVGNTRSAIEDISRAGELGLYEAYSILKRIR